MKKSLALNVATALAALWAATAHAEGLDLKVSGYGTVAVASRNDHVVEFHRTGNMSNGVSNAIDFGNDSRFGLQAALQFTDRISFTGQLVAQRRISGDASTAFGHDKDLDPKMEWMYMQYNALPSVNLRLGRTALPAFLLSDSLNVGFAAPWLRAPTHLYSSQPLTTLDGLQANWHDSLGGFNLSAQGSYGKSSATVVLGGTIRSIESDDTYALNLVAEHGNWLGRVGMVKLNTPTALGTVHDQYISAGLQYDNGDLLVMAEIAKRSENKFAILGDKEFVTGKYGYLAAGYRFGPVMPTLIWSMGNQDQNLPPPTFGAAKSHGKSLGVALRYDVAANIALKAQIDQYQANDAIAFVVPAGDDHKVKMLTIGADFVF